MILGIDPGLDGAIAALDDNGFPVDVIDMPIVEVKRNGRNKRELDITQLGAILRELSHYNGRGYNKAIVELVSAMPKQGVTSAFSFGKTYGVTLGILAACGVRVTHVSPAKWKKDLQVRGGKDASRLRASELWPDAAYWWPLKKHDGRAEAALIGYFGYKHHQ